MVSVAVPIDYSAEPPEDRQNSAAVGDEHCEVIFQDWLSKRG